MSQENNTVLYTEILFISSKQNLLTRVVQTWTYVKSLRAQWTIKSYVRLRVVIPHALSVNLDCNRRHASHVQQAVIFLCNDKRWKIPRDTSLRLNEDKNHAAQVSNAGWLIDFKRVTYSSHFVMLWANTGPS